MQILTTLEINSKPLLKAKKPRIWLTGAEGFIGHNILEQLGEKYDIYTPTHEDLDLVNSVDVEGYLADKYFDVVIHCACVGGRRNLPDEKIHFDINYDMFENILENKEHFKYLINIGSGADVLETWYGKAKRVIAQIIREHKNMINLRCFGVWGKYEKPDRFPTICLMSDEVTIPEDKKMRYIHVDELVKIVDKLIQQWPKVNKRYDLGEPILLSKFAKQLNPNIKVMVTGRGKDYV